MRGYKGPRFWFRYLEVIYSLRKIPRKRKILEIGAGTLELSSYFAKKGHKVTALDLSSDLIPLKKELPTNLQKNIRCIESDFLKYNFKNEKFDVIIAMEVLEHVKEEKKFLKKVQNLICKNGVIVISVPAHMSMWSRDDEMVGHVRRYDKKDMFRVKRFFKPKFSSINSYGWPWINITRYLRIVSTDIIYKESNDSSQVDRSIVSGQRIKKLNFLKFFINEFTVFPFWLVSRLFVKINLSEGYIIFMKI